MADAQDSVIPRGAQPRFVSGERVRQRARPTSRGYSRACLQSLKAPTCSIDELPDIGQNRLQVLAISFQAMSALFQDRRHRAVDWLRQCTQSTPFTLYFQGFIRTDSQSKKGFVFVFFLLQVSGSLLTFSPSCPFGHFVAAKEHRFYCSHRLRNTGIQGLSVYTAALPQQG